MVDLILDAGSYRIWFSGKLYRKKQRVEGRDREIEETQREREKERERRKYQLVVFLYVPLLGVESTTWVLALTGNRTCNLSVYGMMLQPTEPYWPGCL